MVPSHSPSHKPVISCVGAFTDENIKRVEEHIPRPGFAKGLQLESYTMFSEFLVGDIPPWRDDLCNVNAALLFDSLQRWQSHALTRSRRALLLELHHVF